MEKKSFNKNVRDDAKLGLKMGLAAFTVGLVLDIVSLAFGEFKESPEKVEKPTESEWDSET